MGYLGEQLGEDEVRADVTKPLSQRPCHAKLSCLHTSSARGHFAELVHE